MKTLHLATVAIGAIVLASCSGTTEKKSAEAPKPAPSKAAPEAAAAGTYKIRFTTTKGPFVVEVHRDWAPIGAKRFEDLVKDRYYDGAAFFRVVPNFVIQFGIAANPAATKKWDKRIDDDPVRQTNRRGSLAFATMGPNTRTAQVFINLRSNQILDDQGFAPFAVVIEGMEVVEKLYSGYGERPDQEQITRFGNAYLKKNFPNLDYIKTAEIL